MAAMVKCFWHNLIHCRGFWFFLFPRRLFGKLFHRRLTNIPGAKWVQISRFWCGGWMRLLIRVWVMMNSKALSWYLEEMNSQGSAFSYAAALPILWPIFGYRPLIGSKVWEAGGAFWQRYGQSLRKPVFEQTANGKPIYGEIWWLMWANTGTSLIIVVIWLKPWRRRAVVDFVRWRSWTYFLFLAFLLGH